MQLNLAVADKNSRMPISVVFCLISAFISCVHSKDTECGIPNNPPNTNNTAPDEEKIIGGHIVEPEHKYPWIVSLHYSGLVAKNLSNGTVVWENTSGHTCGGSIVSATLILTAAHCLPPNISTNFTLSVYAGLFDQNKTKDAMKLDINWTRQHEKFKLLYNDFGLIKLSKPITFNENVRPVCLPATNEWKRYEGDADVAGWGFTEPFGNGGPMPPRPELLSEVALPFISNSNCTINSVLNGTDIVTDWATTKLGNETMVCAGYQGTGSGQNTTVHKTFCRGDSGGPVVIKGANGTYTQVGIVSWTNIGCNRDPAVSARVTAALGWIKENM